MAKGTIRGLVGVRRALADIRHRIDDDVRAALGRKAEPIAADARSRLSRYQGADIAKIRPRVGLRDVYITDYAQPFTGTRGDFGSLLYVGIWQAVKDNEIGIFRAAESAVDLRTIKEGF